MFSRFQNQSQQLPEVRCTPNPDNVTLRSEKMADNVVVTQVEFIPRYQSEDEVWSNNSESFFPSKSRPDVDYRDEDSLHSHQVTVSGVCGSKFVILENNFFRRAWTILVALLVIYIGTWYFFQLCFIDNHKPDPLRVSDFLGVSETMWIAWTIFLDILFWIDLVVGFFFSFRDSDDNEVCLWPRILKRYLSTFFLVNFIACLPEDVVAAIVNALGGNNDSNASSANKASRTLRLQRISRLLRLHRLSRLGKIAALKNSPLWRWIQSLRGVRIMNILVGLFFAVHLLACGWYLCAAFQDDVEESWLARRWVDKGQTDNLLTSDSPYLQWLHAMYFVLTIFTTVGFGDISPLTSSEICYVMFLFLVGSVVHSVIIGEVINTVTKIDEQGQFITDHKLLVERFSNHTELSESLTTALQQWTAKEASKWFSQKYDKEAMRQLITSRFLGNSLLAALPEQLFQGDFGTNSFFNTLPRRVNQMPPRVPALMALSATRNFFHPSEVVYQKQEISNCLFLVSSGLFAHVGLPTSKGGVDMSTSTRGTLRVSRMIRASSIQTDTTLSPYQLFSSGNYFGEHGIFSGVPRKATVRCEAEGCAIVVPKADVQVIAKDFPEFFQTWIDGAVMRERNRMHCRSRLSVPRNYKHLAAATIQHCVRKTLLRSRPSGLLAIMKAVDGVTKPESNDTEQDDDEDPRTSSRGATSEGSMLLREIRLLRAEVEALRRDKGHSELVSAKQNVNGNSNLHPVGNETAFELPIAIQELLRKTDVLEMANQSDDKAI